MKKLRLYMLAVLTALTASSCSMMIPGSSSSTGSDSGSTSTSTGGSTSNGSTSTSTGGSTSSGSSITSTTISTSDGVIENKGKYTVLIYMCGSDLESQNYLASANIEELVSSNISDELNVVIETGGAKKWSSTYGISSTKNSRYIVRGDKLVLLETKTRSNMGSYSTLQSFVEYGIKNFSAEKMSLIFWNHGGAMQGVCFDENSNDSLTNSEVKKALTNAFNKTNRTEKFEWVGYDACLMAVADVASFNSQFFNYMVSSQESEPGEGWDYDGWVKYLLNNINVNTTDLLKKICDTYYDKVAAAYNSYGVEYRGYNDTTLSVLDLSKAATFESEFENIAASLKSKITSSFKLSSLLSSAQQFGYDDQYGYTFDVYDADDVFSAINTTYSINISALTTALNNYVIYNKVGKDSSGACGLCLFSAQSGYASKTTEYNSSNTNYTNWLSINNSYGSWY